MREGKKKGRLPLDEVVDFIDDPALLEKNRRLYRLVSQDICFPSQKN